MAKNISRFLEKKKNKLIKELESGKKSDFVKKFNRKRFIKNLYCKYVTGEL